MDYPFSERNWVCRLLGHRYGRMYLSDGAVRQTCLLDGKTIPPFRKVKQHWPLAPGEDPYLPADQQPPGAM